MKWLLCLLLLAAIPARAVTVYGQCSGTTGVTAGTLTLRVISPRATGIGPLLVFFDATGTTDSATLGGANNPFQDIEYNWAFGDTGSSGAGTWAYGSSPGHNSRNVATGGVAAHLYNPNGRDTSYTMIVSAFDGTNTAVCGMAVRAYDPGGTNGFAGTKTTCVSASGTPVAGAGGCPAGAAVLSTSSFNTALSGSRSNKRTLFKCSDTFSGDNYQLAGQVARVGAYGGCESTKINRPILLSSGTNDEVDIVPTAGDLVISDIDFHGNGTANGAIGTLGSPFLGINYQVTLFNVNATGTQGAFSVAQAAQYGIIDSAMQNMGSHIGVFINYSEINPPPIGMTGNTVNNLDYTALIGDLFNGTGNTSTGAGQEVVRLSACRMCTINNSTFENANSIGGVLKIHGGNTYASCGQGFTLPATCPTFPCPGPPFTAPFTDAGCWVGVYVELLEISDNAFLGTSGGVPVDIEPQSSAREEHLRNIVFERNYLNGVASAWGAPGQIRMSAVNFTVRNNVFYNFAQGPQLYQEFSMNFGQLGLEPVPTGWEIYNNTCVIPNSQDNQQSCIALNGVTMHAPPNNGVVKNNLFFANTGTHTMILNTGTGNTISNNSANNAGNPGFINGSGSFSVISDFKPTANYSGGTSVPNFCDASTMTVNNVSVTVCTPWSPTWDLGAVKH